MLRGEIADPRDHVSSIANLLRDTFDPPCVAYTDEYVRFHLNFPGPTGPLATLGYEDDRLIGCGCLLPRRFQVAGRIEMAYLASFAAARPEYRGRGAIRALLLQLKTSGVPIVVFCETGSTAQAWTLQLHAASGYRPVHIGDMPLYGFAGHRHAPAGVEIDAPASIESYVDATSYLQTGNVLWQALDTESVAYLLSDHRLPMPIVVRASGGTPLATALLIRSEIQLPDKVSYAPTLQYLTFAQPNADALLAMCFFARDFYGDDGATLLIPNATGLDENTCRKAGARKLHTGYSCYVSTAGPECPAQACNQTNVEIT